MVLVEVLRFLLWLLCCIKVCIFDIVVFGIWGRLLRDFLLLCCVFFFCYCFMCLWKENKVCDLGFGFVIFFCFFEFLFVWNVSKVWKIVNEFISIVIVVFMNCQKNFYGILMFCVFLILLVFVMVIYIMIKDRQRNILRVIFCWVWIFVWQRIMIGILIIMRLVVVFRLVMMLVRDMQRIFFEGEKQEIIYDQLMFI